MPLTFLNPLALSGIAGAAIPLVIHLIQKKPVVPRPFAAIEFILRSQKKSGRRYRIKQLLLLILRMSAIGLLALTIAGPLWKAKRIPVFSEALPTHWVIIIDDSFSMGYGDNFQRAKNAAARVISKAGVRDQFDLLLLSGRDSGVKEQGMKAGPELIKEKISSFELTHSTGSIVNILEEGGKLLSRPSPELNRRLILITDLTAPGWYSGKAYVKVTPPAKTGFSDRWEGKATDKTVLEIIDVGDPAGQPNLAVKEIKVLFPPGGEEEMVIIEFKVANYSNEDVNILPASLLLDGKEVEKGFLKVDKRQEVSKRFYYPLKKGKPYRGSVAIAPDKLKIDDTRYFSVYDPPPRKVLIVNGDPGTSLYSNEVYYLERALNPSEEGGSPFRTKTVAVESLSGEASDLEGFSAIILANVGFVKEDLLVELSRFIRNGGGLLIAVGDKTVPAEFNRSFQLLLPQRLDKIMTQEEGSKGLLLQRAVDTPAPFLSLLKSESGSLSAARFDSYFSLVPGQYKNPQTVLAFSNGAPALVESTYGKGKVLLYPSTIDRDWNNLPIQTAYLPFIHQLVDYMGKKEGEETKAIDLLVGEAYGIIWDEGDTMAVSAKIVDPENRPHNLILLREGRETKAEFSKTDLPGNYRLMVSVVTPEQGMNKTSAKEIEAPFVVNLDTEESDLRRLTGKEIEELLRPQEVKIISWGKAGSSPIEESDEDKGVALWSFFLFLLSGVLLAESFIANKKM